MPVLPNPPRLIEEPDGADDPPPMLEPPLTPPPLDRYAGLEVVERYPLPPNSHKLEPERCDELELDPAGGGSGAHTPLPYTHGR